jgi:hypothetical protein
MPSFPQSNKSSLVDEFRFFWVIFFPFTHCRGVARFAPRRDFKCVPIVSRETRERFSNSAIGTNLGNICVGHFGLLAGQAIRGTGVCASVPYLTRSGSIWAL